MPVALFWTFVLIMLFFGVAVVVNRNPVASALSLVVCFLALSRSLYFVGCVFPWSHPDPRLRGRGHGAVPFHYYAAGPKSRAAASLQSDRDVWRRRCDRPLR